MISRYKRSKNIAADQGPRKALLYARVSTRDQEREGYSIPAQVKLLEDYAALNGMIIVDSHIDVETAGKAGRSAFGEMIRQLRRSAGIRVLLVEKTDRLYRNIKDWATIDDLGIDVHFVKENFVLSDRCRSSEKFMHGIKVLMAKSYIDNLSEEASKGMLEKARQGLWPSYAPIGYENVIGADRRKAVVIDPKTGPLVSLLFEWFASGCHSLISVTERARAAGLKGRRGNKPVCVGTVHRALRNRFYTGSFDWADETHDGAHEPLVSVELWQAVQDILDRRASSNVRVARHKFPFGGLIKCGHCGCAIVAQIKKGRYIYYHRSGYRGKCPEAYVRQEVIEQRFIGILRQLDCCDRDFGILRSAIGIGDGSVRASGVSSSRAGMRKSPDVPGTFTREGIDLLDMARGAHRSFPVLSVEAKRQILGLLLSRRTWANGDLKTTFVQPFALFAQLLASHMQPESLDSETLDFIPLRNLLQAPNPRTRQLIARYNAMADLIWEIGRTQTSGEHPHELEVGIV